MNESLDLRNRILKMRKSNNLALDQVKSKDGYAPQKSESFPEKIEKKIINQEKKSLHDMENVKPDNKNKNDNFLNANNNKPDLLTKNINKAGDNNKHFTNNKSLNSLADNNEAQFRMIANKFNEAVEVILELSEKVRKLEETIYNLPEKSNDRKSRSFFFIIKAFFLFIVLSIVILVLFTFPIDISLIKLIIADVIASI